MKETGQSANYTLMKETEQPANCALMKEHDWVGGRPVVTKTEMQGG